MLDQLFGLILLGLGLHHPGNPNVKGDETEMSSISGTPKAHSTEDTDTKDHITREQVLKNIHEHEQNLTEVFDTRRLRLEKEVKNSQETSRKKTEADRKTFTAKLATFKDDKKKTIAAYIDTKLADINKRRTSEFMAHLTNMREVLDKISDRATEAKKAGKDISKVESLVTAAQGALASAQTGVTTQAGKSYVATISSEAAVGQNIRDIMQSLELDLHNTRELMMAARKAVGAALEALRVVMGESHETTQ
jgi:hypothetical protein